MFSVRISGELESELLVVFHAHPYISEVKLELLDDEAEEFLP